MEPQASSPRTTRPRGNTGFSVTSAQSDRTSRSKELKQRESHDQKNHLSETTKANPNAAMTEMQPMQQQLAESTMVSLRGGQYTDMNGVLITDPDFSNPTRHRGERPLATIRSFEAAIDSEWKRSRGDRPESMMRNDSAPEGYDFSSRRSSAYWVPSICSQVPLSSLRYFLPYNRTTRIAGPILAAPTIRNGHDQVGAGSRFSHVSGSQAGGYYNQRGDRSSFYDNGNGYGNGYGNGNGYGQRPRPNNRQQSESAINRYNNGQGVYPSPYYGQSSATVNTGGSNGSASDQWQQSTDPSSESSSINRDGQHAYAVGAGPRRPIAEEGHYTYNQGNGNNNEYHQGFNGPPVPTKTAVPPRQVIPLGASSGNTETYHAGGSVGGPVGGRPEQEKRKSWLRRTFSKGG
ncbi:hypothetical protein EG328_010815 [Venturia inaequalis]|uniref:Uncharacterized protein n=1 Tax=Venturia inaequalis TaxID=5025 RepID=A0A8H3V8F6_VENIN|nr:hypothetical protein EG328_010815 [Venturia inaequalis]